MITVATRIHRNYLTNSSNCLLKVYPTLESQPVIRTAFPAAVTCSKYLYFCIIIYLCINIVKYLYVTYIRIKK